ncbi:prokaryotic type I DNA topoisomerase [Violaceomyces palustris]|uniref:Prokaryotic type I DNA topoisomerase n=1 Tax=Violaceomyces palustris TaxID=1673888 RepID=A0ACD0NQ95_9BASI|nr:prokaryotic type I DNA topoisomerase [Violaceomyces palustris]
MRDSGKRTVNFSWERQHLFDHSAATILLETCIDAPEATVVKVESKQARKWKPYPLTTVELQKCASRLLHLAPKRILDIAETLYQKGFLSYPRTETDQYDKDFDFQTLIAKQISDPQWGQIATRLRDGEFERPRDGKKNDKAHPPIHPTAHANDLTGDDKRVYDYVTRRFLGSCWKDAIGQQTHVTIQIASEHFKASGLIIHQRNYLEVCTFDRWEGNILPTYNEGETFMPTSLDLKDGHTTRPKHLTEADLVNLMDKNGIGTDATIAEHIAKVIERRYVMASKQGQTTYLVPSTLGIGLVEGYNRIDFDKSLSKPLLRRETEFRMKLICEGQRTKQQTIDESLDEYRMVYAKAKREFETIVGTVDRYVSAADERDEDDGGAAEDGGDMVGINGAFDGDEPGPPPAGSRSRGRPSARGTRTSTRGSISTGRGGSRTAARRAAPERPSDRCSFAEPSRMTAPRQGDRNGKSRAIDRSEDGPGCHCGNPTVERTVVKDGPNKGRKFWRCPKPMGEGDCNFFAWADENAGGSVPQKRSLPDGPETGSHHRYLNQFARDGRNEIERCNCGLEARLQVVSKEGANQGRQFYACPKEMKSLRCNFFSWNDESSTTTGSSLAVTSNSSASASSGSCFTCGQSGHWSSECTNRGSSNYTSQSSHSARSRSGGMARNGGASSSGRGGVKSGSRSSSKKKKSTGGDDSCFKCGQSGHWASSCPNE